MKKKKVKVHYGRIIIFVVAVLVVGILCFFLLKGLFKGVQNIVTKDVMYAASTELSIPLYDMNYNEVSRLKRGTKVTISKDKITNNEIDYYKINYEKTDYYVLAEDLVSEEKDVVKEKEMYVRTALTLYENSQDIKILSMIDKGSKLEITGYNYLEDDGSVNMYKVKYNDQEGYVYGKYLVSTEEQALANYDEDGSYQIHVKRGDSWGGGDAANLDYYPYEKPKFENNVMPEEVRALYMNAGVVYNECLYFKS